MKLKQILIDNFRGKTVNTADIVEKMGELYPGTNKNTILWALYDMVKNGEILRCGRGKYDFSMARVSPFRTELQEDVENVLQIIQKKFKYVNVVVTDSSWFSEYIVQQPFSTVVRLEVNEPAIEAIARALREYEIDAFSVADILDAEKYATSSRVFVIDKIRFNNPALKYKGKVSIAKLEKIMVDLVCDDTIYRQYQGWELENFYENVLERCSINFSTIIKYASSRMKNEKVIALLKDNERYKRFVEVGQYD